MVSLPRVQGEKPRDRDRRVALEKISASQRRCDFCASKPIHGEEQAVTQATETEQSSSSAGRPRSVLRKLSDEQELELTRLYSQTETPVPDIARRFGLGESSVYRISQRHGAGLRSATATPTAAATSADGKGTRRQGTRRARAEQQEKPRRRAGRPAKKAEASAPAATAATATATAAPRRQRASARGGRTATRGQAATGRRGATRAPRATASAGTGRRFRVVYLAETIIEAKSIREAIAKAESQGATDVTSVTVAN